VAEHGWRRLDAGGRPHDTAFERGSAERRVAHVTSRRDEIPTVIAGIEELLVLKSAGSAFTGYPRDRYTTLKETDDRILATSITTYWRYADASASFGVLWQSVRRALVTAFADHDSKSVQHTLYAMGDAVLEECEDVQEISITMPNKHHLLVDLSPFGLQNPNEIFVPTEEPFGLIEATLRRE
jgi:urate oxidase